ncbi:hypothetical protein N7510_000765 [Penicillium lagena]|uniref:uncharacterized protein n=1 Tax=Penicillium lagena TaxID=94218 RepID=UPI002541034D|nr:uncharacterized protein N7510_000765 [Penicillium lagena]KAJ5624456.1 hypothetical protein N7510_000765 [Penicillium lagena]
MAPFKVIIVGGSVAGMALANMLERYGIDFIVLEKHSVVAPQLGASIAMLPNGQRILQQLGCLDAITKQSAPCDNMSNYDNETKDWNKLEGMGDLMEKLFGYKMWFMDRQHLIRTLFDNLQDKSRVLTSCPVVKIEWSGSGVEVETTDATVYHGDLVVGADGVHSHVAQEMQRLGDIDTPGIDLLGRDKALSCSYRCIFGISKNTDGKVRTQFSKSFQYQRSYLFADGPNGTWYWFAFFKNDEKTHGQSIPRYNDEDKEKLAVMYKDDVFQPGLTFGDAYKDRIFSALVALEEGILDTCFYKRIVLTGDAWHKIHPVTGQGGNNAIVSAAYLANKLKELTSKDAVIEDAELKAAFHEYSRVRRPLVKDTIQVAHLLQRMESFDTPVLKFMEQKVVSRTAADGFLTRFPSGYTAAVPLKYIPLPSHRGSLPFDDEVKMNLEVRAVRSNIFWISLLAINVLIHSARFQYGGETQARTLNLSNSFLVSKIGGLFSWVFNKDQSWSDDFYYHSSIAAVMSTICIESYRRFFALKPVSSGLLFALASTILPWEYVLPLYFALYILATAPRAFYYPSPRAVDMDVAKAIMPAYIAVYGTAYLYTWRSSTSFPTWLWQGAHVLFPISIALFKGIRTNSSSPAAKAEMQLFGDQDIGLLASFQRFSSFFPSLFNIVTVSIFLPQRPAFGLYYSGEAFGGAAKIMSMNASIVIIMLFALWDLRRVHATDMGFVRGAILILLLSLALTPAGAFPQLWIDRETKWQQGRQRVNKAGDRMRSREKIIESK